MEILGCGMVHPEVFKKSNLENWSEISGFAFGMGGERLAMLKYGMPDLRHFFENNLSWLNNYGFSFLEQKWVKNDIYINLNDNLKFCNTTSFGASKRFITNYFLPEAKKTSDLDDLILERNMSRAVLKAVADGLILSNVPVYSHLKGFIGTNGKELKINFFKKIKLYFFRKLKKFFMSHKKY